MTTPWLPSVLFSVFFFFFCKGAEIKSIPGATANYTASLNRTGFDFLEITAEDISPELAFRAVGELEGELLAESISMLLRNVVSLTKVEDSALRSFYLSISAFLDRQVDANRGDPYWDGVGWMLEWVRGIGVGTRKTKFGLSDYEVWLVNAQAELGDLLRTLNVTGEAGPVGHHLSRRRWRGSRPSGHCSAIVQWDAEAGLLSMAHTTWTDYASMLRVWRTVTFKGRPNVQIRYSGYPGVINSIDDWFESKGPGHHLVITETTNDVYNDTLFRENAAIVHERVPEFIRAVLATAVARTGEQWQFIFGLHNNGCYNNQFMVVDLALLGQPGPLKEGTLWVSEQAPTLFKMADMTSTLQSRGHWVSFNIPSPDLLYEQTGWGEMLSKTGSNQFSYTRAGRPRIFARALAGGALSLDGLKKLMRYNDFQHDPLSGPPECQGCTAPSPELAISARMDLVTPLDARFPFPLDGAGCWGAIDVKLKTSQSKEKTFIISGPTTEGQVPFSFSSPACKGVPHFGVPETWNFDWMFV